MKSSAGLILVLVLQTGALKSFWYIPLVWPGLYSFLLATASGIANMVQWERWTTKSGEPLRHRKRVRILNNMDKLVNEHSACQICILVRTQVPDWAFVGESIIVLWWDLLRRVSFSLLCDVSAVIAWFGTDEGQWSLRNWKRRWTAGSLHRFLVARLGVFLHRSVQFGVVIFTTWVATSGPLRQQFLFLAALPSLWLSLSPVSRHALGFHGLFVMVRLLSLKVLWLSQLFSQSNTLKQAVVPFQPLLIW